MTGVRVVRHGGVGLVELAEPESHNALSVTIRDGLLTALCDLETDGVGAVVITGAGKSFCAGGDLKAMPTDEAGGYEFIVDVFSWFEAVECYPVPTVAAVNGAALGGGTELAIACDLVLAAETARFGLPETGLGLIAPFAAARLAGRVPPVIAKELALTGRAISAQDAARFGLVNRVVARDELLPEAIAIAAAIAQRSRPASQVTKQLHNSPRRVSAEQAARVNAPLFADPDTGRRIRALVDPATRDTER
jgi:enoyl-CoA hydratase/carnithine racemase